MSSLGQDLLVSGDRFTKEERGIGNVFFEPPGVGHIFFIHLVQLYQRRMVKTLEQKIRFAGVARKLITKRLGVQEIGHPDTLAVDLVRVRRPDAAAGGADLLVPLKLFAR